MAMQEIEQMNMHMENVVLIKVTFFWFKIDPTKLNHSSPTIPTITAEDVK